MGLFLVFGRGSLPIRKTVFIQRLLYSLCSRYSRYRAAPVENLSAVVVLAVVAGAEGIWSKNGDCSRGNFYSWGGFLSEVFLVSLLRRFLVEAPRMEFPRLQFFLIIKRFFCLLGNLDRNVFLFFFFLTKKVFSSEVFLFFFFSC